MNKEEMMIDRYYDSLYSKYEEEEKVPLSDYQELGDRCDKLEHQIQDLIEFIRNNDIVGAYEYAVKENLVW